MSNVNGLKTKPASIRSGLLVSTCVDDVYLEPKFDTNTRMRASGCILAQVVASMRPPNLVARNDMEYISTLTVLYKTDKRGGGKSLFVDMGM